MFDKMRAALGKVGEAVAKESSAWKIQCTTCGRQRSLASVGGIRYGASGTKFTLGLCSRCGGLRIMRIYKSERSPV